MMWKNAFHTEQYIGICITLSVLVLKYSYGMFFFCENEYLNKRLCLFALKMFASDIETIRMMYTGW